MICALAFSPRRLAACPRNLGEFMGSCEQVGVLHQLQHVISISFLIVIPR